ncbi:bestrophin family protein [Pedobacter alpinus]|uniref:Bestrophin family protein n=1 Tax=Pedobacter alpinus TaxID=1590643 RepID=A0ABW5TR47_9SPHI
MINYNPKEWFTFIFRVHKADTFRKLVPLMIAVSIYAGALAYLELEYWNLADSSYVKNLSLMHGILGFVISLLLVFRTNTAYDRWWEGRKQWGALTNSSRNLAIKLHAYLVDAEDRKYFTIMISNFAFALKNHLRENEDYHEIDPVLDLHKEHHLPNQIASAIYEKAYKLQQENKLSVEQMYILNGELTSFTDICGACERIKNTPIPFSYSVFIKKFIFFFVMTLPFGWVFSLGYFIIPVVVFILYAFASLELIAEEIENPFGTDANDLPIDSICKNIKKHVKEILD